jgi:DNA-binding winged helix-turn-helix (wHTH) protein/predicted ATPase
MGSSRSSVVPTIRIEAENEWAWCGDRRLELMPKAFAVLRHLVDHAGRLITKQELLETVWSDAAVSEAALSSCIRDLRKALGDSPQAPRYIETVHRRGFRFIGPVARGAEPAAVARAAAAPNEPAPSPTLVAREGELARLHELFGRATKGRRQLVFVTGEPGIGKTALVEAFLAQHAAAGPVRIGRGQCVEQYGAGEAYLPVLEAIGSLGRRAGGEEIVRVLKQHAPTWLAQLPALVVDPDLDTVQRRAVGATRERMLRELVDCLDALTVESPLVLVLEDLHWSDSATIDLLAMLARRREVSRLLVLGTYRPADVAVSDHPLKAAKRELELHAQCEEIALEFLGVDDVTEYLVRRFAQRQWPAELARMLHRKTDGNPLFLVNTVDDLVARAHLREADGRWVLATAVKDLAMDAPETLWQMVEQQVDRLAPEEQALLAIASAAGAEFSAAIATVDGIDGPEAERRFESLARRGQFVRPAGVAEWPDGTVAARYAFIHALYQHVLYARVPAGRRVGLHLRIGERLERAHGPRTGEIAGELAMHFAEGRDPSRAADYHLRAGETALRQHGYREAADHLRQALDLLEPLPASPELLQQQLTLHMMLGSALTAIGGHATREVERSYARARELCEHVDDTERLFRVLPGLGWFYLVRGSLTAARDIGRQLLGMAESTGDTAIFLAAYNTLGVASFYGGEFEEALGHLERGIALYDPAEHSPAGAPELRLSIDSGLSCMVHAAWASWALGHPDRAERQMREALDSIRALDHPFSLAQGLRSAAAFHQCLRQSAAVQEHAQNGVTLAREHGFGAVLLATRFHMGWLFLDQGREDEGLAAMRAWVDRCREIRAECLIPNYLGWLADALGRLGQREEALARIDEALGAAARSANHYWTAELHRLRGTLVDSDEHAEASLREAVAIARRQGAKSLELRAALDLARLWARRGRAPEARAQLADVAGWFPADAHGADLDDARALLDELEPARGVRAGTRGSRSRGGTSATPRP